MWHNNLITLVPTVSMGTHIGYSGEGMHSHAERGNDVMLDWVVRAKTGLCRPVSVLTVSVVTREQPGFQEWAEGKKDYTA